MNKSLLNTDNADKQEDAFAVLSDDVSGLWCRPVAVLESPPDSFTFLRDFVQPNVPCIIKNAIPATGGTTKPLTLTLDEIIPHVGGEDAKVTVDVSPDGHGDCIRSVFEESHESCQVRHRLRRMFVKPHEENMKIGRFRDLLRRRGRSGDNRATCLHNEMNGNAAAVVPKIDCNGLEVFPLRHHSNCCADVIEHDPRSLYDEARPTHPPVVYYSRQNDCLRTEFSKLFSTRIFPPTVPFAERAFGTGPPDAINLWIGNERSVSSMHKDHYENLFYVCSGQKEFVLCPPADVAFLHEGEFSTGTFRPASCHDAAKEGGYRGPPNGDPTWIVAADIDVGGDIAEGGPNQSSEGNKRWIEPDIEKFIEKSSDGDDNNQEDMDFPLLSKAHPVKVLVSEGEMLYIPSLWYHRVTQTCETVGINYWFDMKFNHPLWCYFNFLQQLVKVEQQG